MKQAAELCNGSLTSESAPGDGTTVTATVRRSHIDRLPLGAHIVRFCEDAPCHVAGGRAVFDAIRAALELEPGETSPDGKWTFLMTSCIGLCGVAPAVMVDDDVYGNVTPERVAEILTKPPTANR